MCDEFIQELIDEYHTLMKSYTQQCKRENLPFDEDIFISTMEKCIYKIPETNIDCLEKAENYMWVAFKKNTLNMIEKGKNKPLVPVDESVLSITDEPYNADIDALYKEISDSIIEKYGEKWEIMFKEHVEKGIDYKALSEKYGEEFNVLHNTFKSIRKYIKKKYERKWNQLY